MNLSRRKFFSLTAGAAGVVALPPFVGKTGASDAECQKLLDEYMEWWFDRNAEAIAEYDRQMLFYGGADISIDEKGDLIVKPIDLYKLNKQWSLHT